MAIGPGYRTFTFDGQNSGNYDVGISGQAVYNAPEREVEMIAIPGRNGAFALDKGRFENIEVTYPAAIYGVDQENFAEKLSDLRNMLASRRGYCRLQDDYNPDEYRLAVYKSGLDVDPVPFQRAGQFNITFECKPQRYLTSGETAVEVTSGDTLTNPTLFEASPLLVCKGYGDIHIGIDVITIHNTPLGKTRLARNEYSNSMGATMLRVLLNSARYTAGDVIIVPAGATGKIQLFCATNAGNIETITTTESGSVGFRLTADKGGGNAYITAEWPNVFFTAGTSRTVLSSVSVSIYYYDEEAGTYKTGTVTLSNVMYYDSQNERITMSIGVLSGTLVNLTAGVAEVTIPEIYVNSTMPIDKDEYIDLDIGEAWVILDDEPTSLNNVVNIPAKLPILKSGSNTITYDNTITNLKVTPRWWKV